MAQFEQALFRFSVKAEAPTPPVQPADCNIDLQRFRLSYGLVYRGPFHAVEPFLNWLKSIKVFFDTKGVSLNKDKICIAGGLIHETNTLAFYTSHASTHVLLSWDTFRANLLASALPALWMTKLREQLRLLKMGDSESFVAYSTRARTLRTMMNFLREVVSEFKLAEALTFGLTAELKMKVHDFQWLLASPFKYSVFKQQVAAFDQENLPHRGSFKPRATTSINTPSATKTSAEDNLWRLRSYLDSKGLCHHCKKPCGNTPGACTERGDRSFINIPLSFVTPPNPADYVKPRPKGPNPSSMAGRPTHPPAGRSTAKAASVAALTEDVFPEMNEASIAALAALDKELALTAAPRD